MSWFDCCICGSYCGYNHNRLCSKCQSGITAFKRSFGYDQNVVTSALAFLELHGLVDESFNSSPQVGEKRCARCQQVKPLTEFYHYKNQPISYCRPCNSAYHAERNRVNKK